MAEQDKSVRGMPKSGRFWKTPKTKFSSINKTKGLKLSFERKQHLRADIKKTRELSRALINERNAENEARKERRRENIKRRAENQKKSEIVQVIKNPAKIKRMRKKAMRQIEKRDTLNM
ncbi:coiled-coil domain-containing protein 86 [Adelges cooleyi]|uniref:coiled-coil domain-containing protein 86 n=1 Tax=Adelges cooleyi TaxID=133065 RepID=UPI00217FE736|nr:coiled-coil domain-containing protein 86 [Adelges cooleyi]